MFNPFGVKLAAGAPRFPPEQRSGLRFGSMRPCETADAGRREAISAFLQRFALVVVSGIHVERFVGSVAARVIARRETKSRQVAS